VPLPPSAQHAQAGQLACCGLPLVGKRTLTSAPSTALSYQAIHKATRATREDVVRKLSLIHSLTRLQKKTRGAISIYYSME